MLRLVVVLYRCNFCDRILICGMTDSQVKSSSTRRVVLRIICDYVWLILSRSYIKQSVRLSEFVISHFWATHTSENEMTKEREEILMWFFEDMPMVMLIFICRQSVTYTSPDVRWCSWQEIEESVLTSESQRVRNDPSSSRWWWSRVEEFETVSQVSR